MSCLAWYQPVFTFRSLVSHFGSGTVTKDFRISLNKLSRCQMSFERMSISIWFLILTLTVTQALAFVRVIFR